VEMKGEQLISAPQADVWKALNDPEILKACVPGCESIDRKSDTEYEVLMVARIGPVTAKFKGQMVLSDINPPNSYSIAFNGQGGAAGFAKGGASVQLVTEGEGTKLSYEAKANVGGKLAQIGSRLVDMAARKTADDFFQRFKETVSSANVTADSGQPHGHDTSHGHAQPTDDGHGGHDDHPTPVPDDPDKPKIETSTLMFFAAGVLVVLVVAMFTLF
jgi:carbon monoxide dehydrogenase subunit G